MVQSLGKMFDLLLIKYLKVNSNDTYIQKYIENVYEETSDLYSTDVRKEIKNTFLEITKPNEPNEPNKQNKQLHFRILLIKIMIYKYMFETYINGDDIKEFFQEVQIYNYTKHEAEESRSHGDVHYDTLFFSEDQLEKFQTFAKEYEKVSTNKEDYIRSSNIKSLFIKMFEMYTWASSIEIMTFKALLEDVIKIKTYTINIFEVGRIPRNNNEVLKKIRKEFVSNMPPPSNNVIVDKDRIKEFFNVSEIKNYIVLLFNVGKHYSAYNFKIHGYESAYLPKPALQMIMENPKC